MRSWNFGKNGIKEKTRRLIEVLLMWEINRDLFYTICLLFGIFWVVVEGLIAYWVYKMYKLVDKHLAK